MINLDMKPRILCVRPRANEGVSTFLVGLGSEWVDTLSLHADVSTAQGDVDLDERCKAFSPDLIVFEPLEGARPWLYNVENLGTHPHVPRILLLNCDPHNPLLPLSYARLADFRIEAIFQFGVEQTQFMPELDGAPVFSVPLFIDATVFKDYAQPKDIPVSIFSANLLPEFYPWRARLAREIPLRFPTLLYTHPGYAKGSASSFAVRDEAYARLLSRSSFSAADTTRLDYVVRKHLEIPASGSVLLAPESDALKDYGFRDGENCLLGTGEDLYRKIETAMRQHERYDAIRAAGHALVHARYTRQTWTYLLDWLACRRQVNAARSIAQDGPLGTFRAERAAAPSVSTARARTNEVTIILETARHAILHDGDLKAAAEGLLKAESWLSHMTEPRFLLGIIALLRGQIEEGIHRIGRRAVQLGGLGERHQKLDPVELAWLWIAAHVNGTAEFADGMRREADGVCHLSLRRARWLLDGAPSRLPGSQPDLEARRPGDVMSTRWLGQEPFALWCGLVERIYIASAQMHRIPDVLQDRMMRRSDDHTRLSSLRATAKRPGSDAGRRAASSLRSSQ